MNKNQPHQQRGIALVLVLIVVMVLSTLVAGMVFVTETQTWTAFNYKNTTQARYAAEAGVQRTMNWLLNSYAAPTTFTSYNMAKYPVQDTTASPQPIVLSAYSNVSSNYPTAAVQTAYNSALSNQSIPSETNVTFSTYATLLAMSPGTGVSWMGGGNAGVPQTWQITSVGTVAGVRPASVQLQATYERAGAPIFTYGIAGTGNSCGDITFSGGMINSWDSANGGTYAATEQNSGGTIGTNGNVTLSGGSTAVYGTISDSSNIAVGNCPDGVTNNAGASALHGLNLLTQPLVYPNPAAPNPMTPNTNINANSNTCWGATPAGCSVVSGQVVIAPGTYGNLTSNSNIHLTAGTYNFNSVNLNGGSVTLDSTPVVINLGGNGISSGGTLLASQSSTTINSGGVPANLQIVSAAGIGMANPPGDNHELFLLNVRGDLRPECLRPYYRQFSLFGCRRRKASDLRQ